MTRPPERPPGPNLDKARGRIDQQKRLLPEAQWRDNNKVEQQQTKERQVQQQELDQQRKELEQTARQRQAVTELVYNPPVKRIHAHKK